MSQHDTAPALHRGGRVVERGTPESARTAIVLVHGRGDDPEAIMALAPRLGERSRWFLAPAAAGGTWYPQSFMAPVEQNEPYLTSALEAVGDVVERILRAGVARERIVLLGYSQGACLTLEYVARHPARYGAVIGIIGGLIGPPGAALRHAGSLAGTPVFLGCSDIDDHVPLERVQETAAVLGEMGGDVRLEVHAGGPHEVDDADIAASVGLLDALD